MLLAKHFLARSRTYVKDGEKASKDKAQRQGHTRHYYATKRQ